MKRILAASAALGFAVAAAAPIAAAGRNSVSGAYVEARTAQVFTGACVMASEAETMGREAVLAWNVSRGAFNGVPLDGLSVIAAVSGDQNLGIFELGGERAHAKSAVFVDARANGAQRLALVAMATQLAGGTLGSIVNVTPAPIEFADKADEVQVHADHVLLAVNKHLEHDPSCGAQQWFHPLASVDNASVGLAEEHAFTGSALGTKWSDPDKPSAFFGTFSY
jgi:hypothetical protein